MKGTPISVVRETMGLSVDDMAALLYLSKRLYMCLEDCAFDRIPPKMILIVTDALGPEAADKLESAYSAYKKGLSQDERDVLEKRMYPAGRMYPTAE